MSSSPGVRQGCSNLFSKATGGEPPSTKLRPGMALPHITLPTTEVRTGCVSRRADPSERRARGASKRERHACDARCHIDY